MTRRITLLIALCITALGSSLMPAQAAGPVVATGPGGFSVGYLTPVMVVQVGGELTYANLDTAFHDVVSDAPGTVRGDSGGMHLFASHLIGVAKTSPVVGLGSLQSGKTYGFYCSIHPNMRGTLVAV